MNDLDFKEIGTEARTRYLLLLRERINQHYFHWEEPDFNLYIPLSNTRSFVYFYTVQPTLRKYCIYI